MNKKSVSYYGPFFWLAIVSFSVPIVVAAKAFHEVQLTTKPTPHPDASGVDHALWDYLLKTYVENGLVDYDGIARDHIFRTYLRQLSEADPGKLTTSADQLALLCNAYNAFVINGVITHKIRDSVMNYQGEGIDFFDLKEHILHGQTLSLNQIEHELIRKRFNEPRIHVALVCAAKSCPAIRAEAYAGTRLTKQLEDQSIQFANQTKYVTYDAPSDTLKLSPLLDWYGTDWDQVGGYLPWLANRVQDETTKQAILRASRNETSVAFLDYDWSLNSQSPPGSAAPKPPSKKGQFGSGSIPNE
ncbi:hypothetical protein FF011L_26690 [Roseimaritima multifibrata]|uniref:DUF547 domain-containing protein n=1 Tax=Roseimaritima multifibrata TaxID=1930274 RepID=A0A517MG79_9BACT|nr:DUF547 domain-containing protein [Roseimaritima multifibrata]QDS93893.1 hypothetical protein FF011L_26690 [Roseimaritima multifibrata]